MRFTFNSEYPDATNEQKLEQIRLWRNAELAQTDWTQLSDAPVDKDAWAQYRQELRDLPNVIDVNDAELPSKPNG